MYLDHYCSHDLSLELNPTGGSTMNVFNQGDLGCESIRYTDAGNCYRTWFEADSASAGDI